MERNSKLLAVEPDKQALTDPLGQASESTLHEPWTAKRTDERFIRQAFDIAPLTGIELLYRHYYQPLCSHAMRLLNSKVIAEDLVSEIFYQFYLHDSWQQIKTSFRAYLYKAVRNRALNYMRDEKKNFRQIEEGIKVADSPWLRPDTLTEYEQLYNRLEAGIDSLPSQRRRIFIMHRFESKSYMAIAEDLSLSPRTVEVQIRKASRFLRKFLGKGWLSLIFLFLP